MELHEILAHVDHTLLKQDATWEQIQTIVDEGWNIRPPRSVFPRPYVKQAAEYAGGRGENLYGDRFSQRLFHHGFKML